MSSYVSLLVVVVTLGLLIGRVVTHDNIRVIVDGDSSISFEAENTKTNDAVVIGRGVTKELSSDSIEVKTSKVKNLKCTSIKADHVTGVKTNVSKRFYSKNHEGVINADHVICPKSTSQFAHCEKVESTNHFILFGKIKSK